MVIAKGSPNETWSSHYFVISFKTVSFPLSLKMDRGYVYMFTQVFVF